MDTWTVAREVIHLSCLITWKWLKYLKAARFVTCRSCYANWTRSIKCQCVPFYSLLVASFTARNFFIVSSRAQLGKLYSDIAAVYSADCPLVRSAVIHSPHVMDIVRICVWLRFQRLLIHFTFTSCFSVFACCVSLQSIILRIDSWRRRLAETEKLWYHCVPGNRINVVVFQYQPYQQSNGWWNIANR